MRSKRTWLEKQTRDAKDWTSKRKRSRSTSCGDNVVKEEPSETNFTICLRYNAMLFLEFIGKNEMIVVEQPWAPIFDALPDPLVSKTYGLA